MRSSSLGVLAFLLLMSVHRTAGAGWTTDWRRRAEERLSALHRDLVDLQRKRDFGKGAMEALRNLRQQGIVLSAEFLRAARTLEDRLRKVGTEILLHHGPREKTRSHRSVRALAEEILHPVVHHATAAFSFKVHAAAAALRQHPLSRRDLEMLTGAADAVRHAAGSFRDQSVAALSSRLAVIQTGGLRLLHMPGASPATVALADTVHQLAASLVSLAIIAPRATATNFGLLIHRAMRSSQRASVVLMRGKEVAAGLAQAALPREEAPGFHSRLQALRQAHGKFALALSKGLHLLQLQTRRPGS